MTGSTLSDDDFGVHPAFATTESWAFARHLAEAPTLPALSAILARETARLGCSAFCCGLLPPGDAEPLLLLHNWTSAWSADYRRHERAGGDLTLADARRRRLPFSWSEARAARALSPAEEAFLAAATRRGWRSGICAPLHGPGSTVAFLTLMGGEAVGGEVMFPAAAKARLIAVAALAHERLGALREPDGQSHPATRLSAREKDCLKRVGAGHSDREIAEALGISRTTVKYHIDRARLKLGVRTRAQALAQLLLWDDAW